MSDVSIFAGFITMLDYRNIAYANIQEETIDARVIYRINPGPAEKKRMQL